MMRSGVRILRQFCAIILLNLLLPSVHALGEPPAMLPLPASQSTLTRIAFGSCAFQSVEQPVFRALVDTRPDLYLSLGDAIYADYDLATKSVYPVTPETLRREWQVLADNPDWQHLVANVPVMATWDNHDYGHHNAGADFLLKNDSAEIFLDFFGEPPTSPRRQRAGIYTAKIFGPPGRRLQIILLDTRSFKSPPRLADRPAGASGSLGKYLPNADPGATLLGDAQWAWLEDQLQKPAELRLLASSGQVIPDQKGMDEWGNYPLQRQRLLDLIASDGESHVLLLSGNAHFAELSVLENKGRPLLEFTASGLTHVNEEYAKAPNRYRVGRAVAQPQFGLIEIDWANGMAKTLKVIDVSGTTLLDYTLPR